MSRRGLLALMALLVAAGCLDHDTVQPAVRPWGDDLFRSYVAMGSSITAGLQSAGINDSTQALAYPVHVARRAGAYFEIPAIRPPGCPPPLRDPVTGISIDSSVVCTLRWRPTPPIVHNVAVPGARIADALDSARPGSSSNYLTTLILGGRTQVQAMAHAEPSLVSVWLGNNDVLTAGIFAQLSRLTSVTSFSRDLDSLTQAIAATGADAILLGIVPPMRSTALQPGSFLWGLQEMGSLSNVDPDCAPDMLGTVNLVALYAPVDPSVATISCADGRPYVLSASDADSIRTHVDSLNALIAAAAADHGWAYLDVDSTFSPYYAQPDQVRKCQGLDPSLSLEDFLEALVQTCPYPTAPNLYGRLVSFDGIHPATPAHEILADAVIEALARHHGIDPPL